MQGWLPPSVMPNFVSRGFQLSQLKAVFYKWELGCRGGLVSGDRVAQGGGPRAVAEAAVCRATGRARGWCWDPAEPHTCRTVAAPTSERKVCQPVSVGSQGSLTATSNWDRDPVGWWNSFSFGRRQMSREFTEFIDGRLGRGGGEHECCQVGEQWGLSTEVDGELELSAENWVFTCLELRESHPSELCLGAGWSHTPTVLTGGDMCAGLQPGLGARDQAVWE